MEAQSDCRERENVIEQIRPAYSTFSSAIL
jgi:hypothetical protein